MCRIVARRGMASFKAKFPVLQELFAKNHRGALCPPPPSGARVNEVLINSSCNVCCLLFLFSFQDLICALLEAPELHSVNTPWTRVVLDSWVVSQIWLDSDSNESSQSWVGRENQGYESNQSRIIPIVIWVRDESTEYCLSQSWVTYFSEGKTLRFCIYL